MPWILFSGLALYHFHSNTALVNPLSCLQHHSRSPYSLPKKESYPTANSSLYGSQILSLKRIKGYLEGWSENRFIFTALDGTFMSAYKLALELERASKIVSYPFPSIFLGAVVPIPASLIWWPGLYIIVY